jgi:hypothetical protein
MLFCLAIVFQMSAKAPKNIESAIIHVTVFLDGAVVERKAEAQLVSGDNLLMVRNLPKGLDKSQLQVKAPSGTRLMDMDYRVLTPEERGMVPMAKLNDRIEKHNNEINGLQAQLLAMRADLKFIDENKLYQQQDNPSVQQFREMDAYLSQRRKELRLGIQLLQKQISDLEKKSQEAIAELHLLRDENMKQEYALFFTVVASQAVKGAFTIEYFTPFAKWDPVYHVRAGEPHEPLHFEMSAEVAQQSGEDWTNCNLTFSTGTPGLGGAIPEMRVWELGSINNYYPQKQKQTSPNIQLGTGGVLVALKESRTGLPVAFASLVLKQGDQTFSGVTDANGLYRFENIPIGNAHVNTKSLGYQDASGWVQVNRGATANFLLTLGEESSQLDEIQGQMAGVTRGGRSATTTVFIDGVKVRGPASIPFFVEDQAIATVTYSIKQKYDVPGDGIDRAIPIQTQQTPATFVHLVRPALDDHAFLMAHITDWEKLNLLKGKALLYLNGAFMGETVIDPHKTGDTLSLSMGRDQQIIVSRTRIKPRQSTNFFGNTVRHQYNYEIAIRNPRRFTLDIVVEDQIPVSVNKDIGVSKVQIEQGGKLNEKTGYVTWRKEINPTSAETLTFQFEVSYPKGLNINLPNSYSDNR